MVFQGGNTLTIDGDILKVELRTGEKYETSIDEEFRKKLGLLVSIPTIAIMEYSNEMCTIFCGPYISGTTTGYVIQVIDMASRAVYSLRYPFGPKHLDDVKRELGELLK